MTNTTTALKGPTIPRSACRHIYLRISHLLSYFQPHSHSIHLFGLVFLHTRDNTFPDPPGTHPTHPIRKMGAHTGSALRALKFFLRIIQFLCAALILAIFSYFLATLANHGLPTATWIRAVEGIAGVAVLYTALCILAVCCFPAVKPFTSFLSMVLDVCFAAAFIYVASANKGGSASCTSGFVDTPFGSGDASTGVVEGATDGWTALPSLRQACQMETACLAVSVVALFVPLSHY